MTCFFKRGLPFLLTLVLGLFVGSIFRRQSGSTETVFVKPTVIAKGSGFVFHAHFHDHTLRELDNNEVVLRPSEVDQKARILLRPAPQYTEEARANGIEGTVVLKAVFSKDGLVTSIRTVSGLPNGLTEMAIKAALEIEFSPAIKDGRAVSQYIQIEYNFSLY